jgi:hypothetical protein
VGSPPNDESPPSNFLVGAPTALKIWVRRCEKTFSTVSVKMRNTHAEHNGSALTLIADISTDTDFRRFGPDPAVSKRDNQCLQISQRLGGWPSSPLLRHGFMAARTGGELVAKPLILVSTRSSHQCRAPIQQDAQPPLRTVASRGRRPDAMIRPPPRPGCLA